MITLLQIRMYSLFRRQGVMTIGVLALLLVAVAGAGCDGPSSDEQTAPTPLKIGLILNFTGSPEASADRQRAFESGVTTHQRGRRRVWDACDGRGG